VGCDAIRSSEEINMLFLQIKHFLRLKCKEIGYGLKVFVTKALPWILGSIATLVAIFWAIPCGLGWILYRVLPVSVLNRILDLTITNTRPVAPSMEYNWATGLSVYLGLILIATALFLGFVSYVATVGLVKWIRSNWRTAAINAKYEYTQKMNQGN
jgi:hypothetical protein